MRKNSTVTFVIRSCTLACISANAFLPAYGAASTGYQKSLDMGQKAYEQGQYRKAATSWAKALREIEQLGQPATRAATLTKLALAYQGQGQAALATSSLDEALSIYRGLGGVSPEFAAAFAEVAKVTRPVELEKLGRAGEKLKSQSAKMVMTKSPTGAHVQIDLPARFESTLNSQKIDQIALEKSVSFDVAKDVNGTTISNIEGFKIHSVEKGMWVNLLNLAVRQQQSDGTYDAEITAGKAGVQKKVPASLPTSVVSPVTAIAATVDEFAVPIAMPLPVVQSLAMTAQTSGESVPAATTTTTTVQTGEPSVTAPVSSIEASTPPRTQPSTNPNTQPSTVTPPAVSPVEPTTPVAPRVEPAPAANPVTPPVETQPNTTPLAPSTESTQSGRTRKHSDSDGDADEKDDDDDDKEERKGHHDRDD